MSDYNTQVVFGGGAPSGHLGIIIPYRDRQAHLAELLPQLEKFFIEHRRKAPQRVSVLIVEQQGDRDFNSGKLKNVGFALLRDSVDYVCFHDVDYVPLRADYRDPRTGWALLISKGAEVVNDPRGFSIAHDMSRLSGGAILFARDAFQQVNGYSNGYWGWGFEDEDLRRRCHALRIPFARRSGRYRALPHETNGAYLRGGKIEPTPAHLKNKALLDGRWAIEAQALSAMKSDGLASLEFSIVSRAPIGEKTAAFAAEKVIVSI